MAMAARAHSPGPGSSPGGWTARLLRHAAALARQRRGQAGRTLQDASVTVWERRKRRVTLQRQRRRGTGRARRWYEDLAAESGRPRAGRDPAKTALQEGVLRRRVGRRDFTSSRPQNRA